MHKRHGFTVVEIMVVLVVIVSILTMSVMGVRGVRQSTRDRERRADIDSIAIDLETMYVQELRRADSTLIKPRGSYPPLSGGYTTSLLVSDEMLKNLEKNATIAPSLTAVSLRTVSKNVCTGASNATVCYINNAALADELEPSAVTKDNYVYVPLARNGELCTEALLSSDQTMACRSFRLYSALENAPTSIYMIESKRK